MLNNIKRFFKNGVRLVRARKMIDMQQDHTLNRKNSLDADINKNFTPLVKKEKSKASTKETRLNLTATDMKFASVAKTYKSDIIKVRIDSSK